MSLSRERSFKTSSAPVNDINTPDPDDPMKICKDLRRSSIFSDGSQTYRSEDTQVFSPTDDDQSLISEFNRVCKNNINNSHLEDIEEDHDSQHTPVRAVNGDTLEKVTPVPERRPSQLSIDSDTLSEVSTQPALESNRQKHIEHKYYSGSETVETEELISARRHENSKYGDPNDSMFVNTTPNGENNETQAESSIIDITQLNQSSLSTARAGNLTHYNIM